MAKEYKHLDISNNTELLRIVEEMRASNEPRILERDSEELAILRPMKRSPKRRLPHGKPFSLTDSLWSIVGTAHSEGPGDVAENKYKYLAEAYTPKDQ